MQPDKKRLTYLLQKYLHNTISDEETNELFKFIREARQHEVLKEQIIDVFSQAHAEEDTGVMDWDAMFSRLTGKTEKGKNKSIRKIVIWKRVAAAVLILVVGSLGVYVLRDKKMERHRLAGEVFEKVDLQPGGNKAILTLGNGSKIILDSSRNGLLSFQNGTKIVKDSSGLLRYSIASNAKGQRARGNVPYNTITTPRGGQYEVVLPDGSRVWLNAASSLKFPTAFEGDKREVTMTGEAYFEISSLQTSSGGGAVVPFIVHAPSSSGDVAIKVLGTHFNVMAYEDEEAVKTTLIEGAVRVSKGRKDLLLKPGQEASVKQNGEMELMKNVNVMQASAWKNNLFWFENSDVEEVMKQLSRWYDVDIVIEGEIPDLFTGSIPRSLSFSRVFEVLQQTGSIHYKIENDKTIVVMP